MPVKYVLVGTKEHEQYVCGSGYLDNKGCGGIFCEECFVATDCPARHPGGMHLRNKE
jgi:hypothetical protein